MPITRIPFVGTISERSASSGKDFRMINAFVETLEKDSDGARVKTLIVKRAGLVSHNNYGGEDGRGLYYWNGSLWAADAGYLYKDGTAQATGLTASTGRCYFDSLGGTTPRLIVQDWTNDDLYITNAGNTDIVKQTDGDIPTNMVPGVVVLDTYICIMDSNGTIYASNAAGGDFSPADQTKWDATDTLNSEIISDPGVRLIRHHNYLVALNEKSTEFFYNAANPVGESPFERITGSASFVGCAAGETAVNIDDELLFVAQSHNGGRFVAQMDGFSPKPISNFAVNELLNEEKTNITDAYAYQVKSMGHWFYILCLPTTAQKTLVYDLVEKEWSEWDCGTTAGANKANFPYFDAAFDAGVPLLQHNTAGIVYELDPGTYTDAGSNFEVLLQSERWDGEASGANAQNKFIYRATFVGDQQGISEEDAIVDLVWSDDDYQNFTSATYTTFDTSLNRPIIRRLGMTQRRAFRVIYDGDFGFRMEAIELMWRRGHYGH